jgi:hypothetical protein
MKELQKTDKIIYRERRKGQEKHIDSIKGEIMEFQRTQHYDLMYTKAKELAIR